MNNNKYDISEIIGKTLQYYKLSDSKVKGDILSLYKEIVGENIDKISKPLNFENGILFIQVDNSAWKNELFFMRERIKEQFNKYLNKEIVKEIKLI